MTTIRALLIFGLALSARRAFAAGAMPVIESLPAAVELLGPGKQTDLVLALRNDSDQALEQLTLVSLKMSGATAILSQEPDGGRLGPHEQAAWVLAVKQDGPETVNGALNIRIDYVTKEGGGKVRKVVFKSVPVKSAEREGMDKFMDVLVATTLDTLESTREGTLNLLFVNKSSRPVTVTAISLPNSPDFLEFTSKATTPFIVPPFETATGQITVRAKKRVIPGKYVVVIPIRFQSIEGGAATARSTVVKQEFTLGVLGESAIDKLLGVGSFLLLPGFLALTTIGLLYKTGFLRQKKTDDKFPLEDNKPAFGMISVAISLLFAGVARLLLGRWYFVQYSLEDIMTTWLIAIMLGFAAYSVTAWVRIYRERSTTPSEKDQPQQMLEKLARQGLGLVLDRAKLTKFTDKTPVFLVQRDGKDLEPTWVSPGIKLVPSKITTEQLKTATTLINDGNAKELGELLAPYSEALAWDTQTLSHPTKVAKSEREIQEEDSIIV